MRTSRVIAASAVVFLGSATFAQDYGIDFVTVGAAGNAAFTQQSPDFPNSEVIGRGSVNYDYRIGRYEITTAQWMAFVNTFNGTTRENAPPFFDWGGPFAWGAVSDPNYSGPGFRYTLPVSNPNAGMQPVYGIGWRECALYCNWLNNGQSSDRASLVTGAYDTTTWGMGPAGSFTDGLTHLPGARFWIPSLDESIKAAYFDPNRYGPNQAGWWTNPNRSNAPGISGPPGIGTTSAGWVDPSVNLGEFNIPLGAYAGQVSPWGLYDTSGGAREWTEEALPAAPSLPSDRANMGRSAGNYEGAGLDSVYGISSGRPGAPDLNVGFRIASAVPAPGASAVLALIGVVAARRTRR